LRNARDTVARLANGVPSRRLAQTVYKTTTDACRPEATLRPPSPTPVAREDAQQGKASYYDVCREAIVEFIFDKLVQERALAARSRHLAAPGRRHCPRA
jgi:hypothetical protein